MIFYLFGILIYAVPGLWVNYTLNKHDDVLPNMPFTAKEFGLNLLKEQNLDEVNIEDTKIGDHYDTNSKTVRVKPDRLDKKSITSITVMCHEIGHAIQHHEKYKPLEQRTSLVKNTAWISQLGSGLLLMGIPTIFATGSYSLIKVCLILVLLSLIIGVIIHLITLEVELDASFNRALPIIKTKVPEEYHDACQSILKAAAFTYVIGVIRNFVSLRFIWLLLSRIR